MKGLISIIIPVYNCANYIEKCVNSIIDQTYKKLEVIIIDDGSTDDSLEIAYKLAKKDERITVFHQDNQGVSKARNEGIKKAKGEYISFIDSDDWIGIDFYKVLIDGYYDETIDLSVVGVKIVNSTEDNTCIFSKEYCNVNKSIAFNKMFTDKDFFGFPVNKLYRKKIIDRIKGNPFDEKIYSCEDTLFNAKYIKLCDKISYNKSKLYFYYQRNDSATKKVEFSMRKITVFDSLNKINDIFIKESPENLECLYEFYMYNYYLIQLLIKKTKCNYKLENGQTSNYYNYLLKSKKLSFIKKLKIYIKYKHPILFSYLLRIKRR